jgi:hypothetical protein
MQPPPSHTMSGPSGTVNGNAGAGQHNSQPTANGDRRNVENSPDQDSWAGDDNDDVASEQPRRRFTFDEPQQPTNRFPQYGHTLSAPGPAPVPYPAMVHQPPQTPTNVTVNFNMPPAQAPVATEQNSSVNRPSGDRERRDQRVQNSRAPMRDASTQTSTSRSVGTQTEQQAPARRAAGENSGAFTFLNDDSEDDSKRK